MGVRALPALYGSYAHSVVCSFLSTIRKTFQKHRSSSKNALETNILKSSVSTQVASLLQATSRLRNQAIYRVNSALHHSWVAESSTSVKWLE